MAENVEVPAVEDKQKDIVKFEELMLEGLKKLDLKDSESAVDLLSEAVRLVDSIYGTFAPESYTAYMNYGKALVSLASGDAQKIRAEGDVKQGDNEPEQLETTAEESGRVADEEPETDKSVNNVTMDETNEADTTLKPGEDSDAPLEGLELTLKDAWNVLEVAKQICEKQLQTVKEEADIREWKLNLSEPLYFLGRILVFNSKPEDAKVEFIASLDIKQQYLGADDRNLVDTFLGIGDAFKDMYNFADAKHYFEKTLDTLNKRIAALEATKDKPTEVQELQDIYKEVQEKINDVVASDKAVSDMLVDIQGTVKPLNVVDTSSFNDVSHLVKRSNVESGDTPATPIEKPDDATSSVKRPLVAGADSDDIAAKKAKPE